MEAIIHDQYIYRKLPAFFFGSLFFFHSSFCCRRHFLHLIFRQFRKTVFQGRNRPGCTGPFIFFQCILFQDLRFCSVPIFPCFPCTPYDQDPHKSCQYDQNFPFHFFFPVHTSNICNFSKSENFRQIPYTSSSPPKKKAVRKTTKTMGSPNSQNLYQFFTENLYTVVVSYLSPAFKTELSKLF